MMPGSRWERPHRVEEMRHAAHAQVEGGVRVVGARVRVTARDRDLAPQQLLDHAMGAGQLGRERDQPDGPRLQQAIEQLGIRVAARLSGMDPETKAK